MTITATSIDSPVQDSLVSRPGVVSVTAHHRHEAGALHVPASPMTSDRGPELGPQPQPHSCQVLVLSPGLQLSCHGLLSSQWQKSA